MELLDKLSYCQKVVILVLPDFINEVTSLAALIELINSSCFLFQSGFACVHVYCTMNSKCYMLLTACCFVGSFLAKLDSVFFFISSGIKSVLCLDESNTFLFFEFSVFFLHTPSCRPCVNTRIKTTGIDLFTRDSAPTKTSGLKVRPHIEHGCNNGTATSSISQIHK